MSTLVRPWKPKPNPWEPSNYDDEVIYAVRAFQSGTANAGQQGLVWDWLMYVSGEDDWSFRPEQQGGQRATDIALGKQLVGKQFRKMLHPMTTPKTRSKPQPTKRSSKKVT